MAVLLLLVIGFALPAGIVAYIVYIAFIKKRKAFTALEEPDDQAVTLFMHGATIESRHKNRLEFENFVDRLQWALGNRGEVRDVSVNAEMATGAIFGESADEIYAHLRKILRHNSFSEHASVVLRYGPPGSQERRIHMAN
ncbi:MULTISPECIES: hypothetical protein [Bacteria]|uniref:Uncharacterized protein n=2 Tax=Bacteria TaxID=2 RepID=A0A918UGI3_9SPHN|nr:hypothetical protein [Novosphingobium colocasiae]GGZ05865.1 hypothetical protein GCM10011614_20860 [Novosphingobium colocasiae]GLL08849.1 hypothetical protein GCM10017581_106400 [Dactylosporangium matsuzakiense]